MGDFTFLGLNGDSHFHLSYAGFTLFSFLFPFMFFLFLKNPFVRMELYRSLCVSGGEADVHESKGGLCVLLKP